MKTRHQAALLRFALLDAAPLHAPEWKHELMPDLWGSGMDGPVGRPQDTSPPSTRSASQGESWRDPVIAAYRCIDMDYDTGKGADFFEYDMSLSGPALGVVFTF